MQETAVSLRFHCTQTMLCFHFLLFICWSSWEPKLIRLEDFKRTSQPIIKYLITLFDLIYLLIFVYFSLFSPIDCFSLINLLVVHLCYFCYKTTKHYINRGWLYFDLLFASQWKYLKHTLIGRYMMCWSLHCSSGESVQAWPRVTVVNNILWITSGDFCVSVFIILVLVLHFECPAPPSPQLHPLFSTVTKHPVLAETFA